MEQIWPPYFSTYMKQNLRILWTQRGGNNWHLGSISHRRFIVYKQRRVWELSRPSQRNTVELEVSDTIESNTSASYLDQLPFIGRNGQFQTSIYNKRDDFIFQISNFPFLSSNISASSAYSLFISQLNDMTWLALRMEFLLWGGHDFPISFAYRDTSRNTWNHHWGSFVVDTGILSYSMKFPIHKC